LLQTLPIRYVFGDTKISELERISIHDHVRRLEISVNKVISVQHLESHENSVCVFDALDFVHYALFFDEAAEGLAAQLLHD